jgi:DNA-directed RNA polymerase beta' subunit
MEMEVDEIVFGILGNEEIRDMGVIKCTDTNLLARGKPKEGGVIDSRLGSVSNYNPCGTCLDIMCTGHTGYIELDYPVPHINWIEFLLFIAQNTCVVCASAIVTKDIHETGPKRIREYGNRAKKMKEHQCSLCLCPTCGMPQPIIVRDDPFFVAEWPKKTLELFDKIESPKVSREDVEMIMARPYTNWTLSYLLRNISKEDQIRMGFNPEYTCIDGMMLRNVLVPANITRLPPPCDDGDGHGRAQHQLSQQLSDIIKQKKVLQRTAEGKYDLGDPMNTKPMPDAVAKAISMLWWTISRYFRRDKAKKPRLIKMNSYAEKGHNNAQCAGGAFDGKEGLLRQNNTGKRVDFSSRTVIGGDPVIDVDEIGVPERICKILTVPIPVFQANRDGVRQMILDNKIKQLIDPATGNIISTEDMSLESRLTIPLINGWIAVRYLDDGDLVVANRQPTLHKNSQLAHRVRKIPLNTFKFNPCCVEGFNADFDGDEMVIHVPQTIGARAEMEMMYCVHHMFHPRKGSPIFSPIQDGLLGWFLITKDDALFSKEEVINVLSVVKYDPSTPESVHIGDTPSNYNAAHKVLSEPPRGKHGKWTGHQLASALFPPFLTMKKGSVEILKGQMLSGTFSKSTLGSSPCSVVHQCLIYGGGHTTARMLSDMQRVADKYLLSVGFNIGIKDITPTPVAYLAVKEVIEQAETFIRHIREIASKIPPSGRVAQAVEIKTCATLRQILIFVGRIISKTTPDDSAFKLMSKTVGSKGSEFNMAQLMGTVAQTFVMGARPGVRKMRRGMKRRRRNLPNEPLEDDGTHRFGSSEDLAVHGFVKRAFVRGLTLSDVFMQAAGGREGLVDTSAKTPTSGYIQRELVTACIDAVTQPDLTVRDAAGNILSERFALDGSDHTKCFDVTIDLLLKTNKDIKDTVPDCYWKELILLRDTLRKERLTVYSNDITRNEKALLSFNLTVLFKMFGCKVCCNDSDWNAKELLTEFCHCMDTETLGHALALKAHVWWVVASTPCCSTCCKAVLDMAMRLHRNARMYPGEAVGALASTSCGELSTQLVLNTFHFGATGMGGADGIPRVEEIINASKNIVVVMSFEVESNPNALVKLLPYKTLADVVCETEITTTMPLKDEMLLKTHRMFLEGCDEHSIRFVLDKVKTITCGVDVQGVAEMIRNKVNDNAVVIASRRRDEMWVIRLFTRVANQETFHTDLKKRKYNPETTKELAHVHFLRKLRTQLLTSTRLCGIQGVTKAATRTQILTAADSASGELIPVSRTMVDVQGSNLFDIMLSVREIKAKTFSTNDIMGVYQYLGVDCASFVLFHELHKCISVSRVAEHLVKMLVDCITFHGGIMSVNRFGINKTPGRSVLAKMAFEEAVKQITETALIGMSDPLKGVVERSIVGKKVLVGTQVAILRPAITTDIRTTERDFELFNDPVCVSYCEEIYNTPMERQPTVMESTLLPSAVEDKLFSFANGEDDTELDSFKLLSPQWKQTVDCSKFNSDIVMLSPSYYTGSTPP